MYSRSRSGFNLLAIHRVHRLAMQHALINFEKHDMYITYAYHLQLSAASVYFMP